MSRDLEIYKEGKNPIKKKRKKIISLRNCMRKSPFYSFYFYSQYCGYRAARCRPPLGHFSHFSRNQRMIAPPASAAKNNPPKMFPCQARSPAMKKREKIVHTKMNLARFRRAFSMPSICLHELS